MKKIENTEKSLHTDFHHSSKVVLINPSFSNVYKLQNNKNTYRKKINPGNKKWTNPVYIGYYIKIMTIQVYIK